MAGDKKQFEQARSAWNLLLDEGQLSAPPEEGQVAIFCSYYTPWVKVEFVEGVLERKTLEEVDASDFVQVVEICNKELRIFRKEAFALASLAESIGKKAEVILNPQPEDMADVMSDPTFSDVVTVGHGTLSTFLLNDNDDPASALGYSWHGAHLDADHLKTGEFIQRHCGLLARHLNVPLGMFVMADARKIYAPVGQQFTPRGLYCAENNKLGPVFTNPQPSYKTILESLPQTDAAPIA